MITETAGILDLVAKLNKDHKVTIAMVLHDLNLASEYCDQLALISEGEIYSLGCPRDVLDARTIEDVYKTAVVVEKNPVSSKPYVFVVSGRGT